MAYSPHNTIPPHILDGAVRAYAQTVEPVADICARFKISPPTLHRERRARGIPVRPQTWRGRPKRREGRKDRYAPAPQTPKQQAVWEAWRAEPSAGPARWAQVSGATPGYVSRLVGHWEAMSDGRARRLAIRARCPHCGGELPQEARRGAA